MKSKITALLVTFINVSAMAQAGKDQTILFLDSLTRLPVAGVTLITYPQNLSFKSSETGTLQISPNILQSPRILVSALGYSKQNLKLSGHRGNISIYLSPEQTQLSEVKISSTLSDPNHVISMTDIASRGVSNSQEILRMVPGLFISQHQGGGKAEQIFLRGFDNDHGKDIALSMDNMPINMVSHAHGQGYADSHFIIPELVANTSYGKGPFDADKGDLAVSGWVNYQSRNKVDNLLKAEAGQFNTFRGLAMLNVFDEALRSKGQNLYVAAEYRYSDAYFDNPQHFKRFNVFSKYSGRLSEKNWLTLSASAFSSRWNASGQIPEGAAASGKVGYFGAIDPNEGGQTSRYNLNAVLKTDFRGKSVLSNQLYYSRYHFDLFSNFTLFLNDEINGDEIRQRESRNLFGYNGIYRFGSEIGSLKMMTEAGLSARFDFIDNSELSHTLSRYTLLERIKLGDISEYSISPYLSETFLVNEKLSIHIGARYDRIFYAYQNKLADDKAFPGLGTFKAHNGIFSPKLKFNYSLSDRVQTFISLGKGFHSNDARSVVSSPAASGLPAAYEMDLGAVLKPISNMIISSAIWYSYLEQELVYGGDGGTVEFSGKTRRLGADLSVRYQPLNAVYIDIDLNYANGRSVDEPPGLNYIPLAPRWSSTGGVTFSPGQGIGGGLRYRYLAGRPANEDYTLIASGYFITDLILSYKIKKLAFGLSINNLFNVKWKESQFVEETRLKGEEPVEGITFTPGTKFGATASLSYNF
jgi:hypothetical protein